MKDQKLKPIHPGEVLREEFIEPLGFSQREFARKIGVTHTRLNQVVQEKRSITADTALRLARALGTTPRFWMNLQNRFDLDLAEDQHGKKIEAEVQPI
ncbi:HigA family addiction module antitoxin [soil metagenome]